MHQLPSVSREIGPSVCFGYRLDMKLKLINSVDLPSINSFSNPHHWRIELINHLPIRIRRIHYIYLLHIKCFPPP